MGTQWEQRTVSDLDSALNSWLDTVPPFCELLPPHVLGPMTNADLTVRWDPQKSNSLFFRQSACLAVHYHALQLAIHRPFIPSPGKPSPTPFPSLAICTSAARSCVHIMDTVYKRMGPTDALQMCTVCAVSVYDHSRPLDTNSFYFKFRCRYLCLVSYSCSVCGVQGLPSPLTR